MPLMGFREYARHREAAGLVGGTLAAVQTAIKSGRISYLLVDGAKKINQAEADQLWNERSHPDHAARRSAARQPVTGTGAAPPAGQSGTAAAGAADPRRGDGQDTDLSSATYADARAMKERFAAMTAKLEYEERQGTLVRADEVAARWEKVIGVSRTKVLALPSKIRTRLPKLTAADVAVVERLVRETLDELAAGDAD